MNIEDCKIGTRVKLISTDVTGEHLGYSATEMFSIGSVSEVTDFGDGQDGCENVKLSDGSWYAADDLELLKVPEKENAFWKWVLTAHAASHTLPVLVLTQSVLLGLLMFTSHFIIDFLKCEQKIDFNQDQTLHILVIVAITAASNLI